MGISSYAMLLDEYFEHNFCTGSSSSTSLSTEAARQTDKETANHASSTVFKQNQDNSLTSYFTKRIDISSLTNFIL